MNANEKAAILIDVIAKREGWAGRLWVGDNQSRVYVTYQGRDCGYIVCRDAAATNYDAAKLPFMLKDACRETLLAAWNAAKAVAQ